MDLLNNNSQFVAGDILPSDLMLDILCRLPVKSLLKFKCVNKSWYSIIRSPWFTNMHYDHESKAQTDSWILLTKCSKLGIIPPGSNRWTPIGNLLGSREHVIVGSAKGLVCITQYTPNESATQFRVYNPALNTVKFIQARHMSPTTHVSVGFGYDQQHNDFKILRVERTSPDRGYSTVYIYSLRLKSWNAIENSHLQQMDLMIHGCFPLAMMGSCLYWSASVPGRRWWNRIVVFNLSTEKFHVSDPFPGVLCDIAALRPKSVSLIFKVDTSKPWTCIWTVSHEEMEEHFHVSFKQIDKSWLDMNPYCRETCLLRLRELYGKVVSFRNSDEFLVRRGTERYIIYSTRKSKFVNLNLPYCHHTPLQIWCFRESLFALDS